jgi:penicillin-binding protein 2
MAPINIATSEQWDVVIDGMAQAVSTPGGTAFASAGQNAKYKWGGKTGTAQVVAIKQNENVHAKILDERKRDHSWFIAFAPLDDPKIAVAVLVENGGFGAAAAAPIARKVIDAYLLGPPPADQKEPLLTPKPLAMLTTPPSPPAHPPAADAPAGPL